MEKLPLPTVYELSERDVLQAGKQIGLLPGKLGKNIAVTLLMLICAVTFFQQYIIPDAGKPNYPLGVMLIVIALYMALYTWFAKSKAERRFLGRAIFGHVELSFNGDSVTVNGDICIDFCRSQDIKIIAQEQFCAILQDGAQSSVIIPQSAADEQNYKLIYEYLKEKIKPAA